jgi:hypothetical protein
MVRVRIFLVGLLLSAAALAQNTMLLAGVGANSSGAATPSGGFAYGQGTSGAAGTGGPLVQTDACGNGSGSTSCTVRLAQATQVGEMIACGMVTSDTGTGGAITSCYTCAVSTGCNSGNAIDTATLCPSHGCLKTNSARPDSVDVAHIDSSAGGATYMTATITTAPTDGYDYMEVVTGLPPKCGSSYCTATFDTSATDACSFCGATTFTSMALAHTDFVAGIADGSSSVQIYPASNFSSPYAYDFVGNLYALDATGTPALEINSSGWVTLSRVAWTYNYSPSSNPFTSTNNIGGEGGGAFYSKTCPPTCPAITLNTSASSGQLIAVIPFPGSSGSAGSTISSVTDNKSGGSNTYTCPSGFKTTTGVMDTSICYTVSSGTVTTVTPVMAASGSYNFAIFTVAASSGTIAYDNLGTQINSSSSITVGGASISLSGTVDACITQMGFGAQSEYGHSYYSLPQGFDSPSGSSGTGIVGLALNLKGGTALAPTALLSASNASVWAGICFHN